MDLERRLVAVGAVLAPALHLTSNVLERVGGFSAGQLVVRPQRFRAERPLDCAVPG